MADEFDEVAHGVLRALGLSADDTDHPDVQTIAAALRETARQARIEELEATLLELPVRGQAAVARVVINARLAELKKGKP